MDLEEDSILDKVAKASGKWLSVSVSLSVCVCVCIAWCVELSHAWSCYCFD